MNENAQLRVILIGPNASYRRSVAGVIARISEVQVHANSNSVAEVLASTPEARASLVIVDGKAGDSIVQAKQSWPEARIICLLDYVADWELAGSLGAHECVLKDRGAEGILRSISKTQALA